MLAERRRKENILESLPRASGKDDKTSETPQKCVLSTPDSVGSI